MHNWIVYIVSEATNSGSGNKNGWNAISMQNMYISRFRLILFAPIRVSIAEISKFKLKRSPKFISRLIHETSPLRFQKTVVMLFYIFFARPMTRDGCRLDFRCTKWNEKKFILNFIIWKKYEFFDSFDTRFNWLSNSHCSVKLCIRLHISFLFTSKYHNIINVSL